MHNPDLSVFDGNETSPRIRHGQSFRLAAWKCPIAYSVGIGNSDSLSLDRIALSSKAYAGGI